MKTSEFKTFFIDQMTPEALRTKSPVRPIYEIRHLVCDTKYEAAMAGNGWMSREHLCDVLGYKAVSVRGAMRRLTDRGLVEARQVNYNKPREWRWKDA